MEDLTTEELEALDSQPVPRPTPEYTLWLGFERYVLYLRVQVFEKSIKGRWRTIDGLKPFRVHIRQDCALPRLILKARRKYGMGNNIWKLTGREFGNERVVCHFTASGFRPRKIVCTVLERTRALTKKEVRHLSALINRAIRKMLRLLDETEGMYRGERPNQKALAELMDTLDELRSKIRICRLTIEKSLVLDDQPPQVRRQSADVLCLGG